MGGHISSIFSTMVRLFSLKPFGNKIVQILFKNTMLSKYHLWGKMRQNGKNLDQEGKSQHFMRCSTSLLMSLKSPALATQCMSIPPFHGTISAHWLTTTRWRIQKLCLCGVRHVCSWQDFAIPSSYQSLVLPQHYPVMAICSITAVCVLLIREQEKWKRGS